MNRRTRGLRPAPSFKADQYNQWCDQPFDVPLSVRRKITYSLTFLSQRSAYRFAVDLLKAEQQVCFQSGEPPETASKVVASPVMNPMPSNLHGYGAVLKTHVVRIGCAHAQLGRADVSNVESTFEGVTVGFEFPNFARAYRGAVVMLKEGETVQLAARFCLKKQVCLWLELSAGCSAQELQEHIRRVCKLLAPHKAKLIAIGRAAKAVE